jgi:hypothetical protein
VELYPPVLNLLNFLTSRLDEGDQVKVFTFRAAKQFEEYQSHAAAIQIIRFNRPGSYAASRFGSYLKFYGSVLRKLISWKPETVLYYESLSAFPAVFYKNYFNRKCRLMVHYHEYTSPDEYSKGMIINRWGYKVERKAYPKYSWISHANEDRMRLFVRDNMGTVIPNAKILPNYPPRSWKNTNTKQTPGSPVRFIYVGALSLDTMYVKEFSEWIKKQEGKAIWDIYSGNITQEARAYLQSVSGKNIQLKGNVNYFSLPSVLSAYDIGIILYKGHIPNYIYNAPNKLFEYWSQGLDVWYPVSMKTIEPYVSVNKFPKILPVDFGNLDQISLEEMSNRSVLTEQPYSYYCEEVFDTLLNKITERK